MEKPMDYSDALELVKLRMKEDGIGWATAVDEYAKLTHSSKSSALRDIGRHVQAYASECKV